MEHDYNFWIISGEASGDMYGARLAKDLKHMVEEKGKHGGLVAGTRPAVCRRRERLNIHGGILCLS